MLIADRFQSRVNSIITKINEKQRKTSGFEFVGTSAKTSKIHIENTSKIC